MQKKKNDVKARTTLLLSLLDEHQLRFSKYKTARELWAAILKTFGEDMQKKKNDVKARTTLLLSLLDEHQLRFSKYKTARELWAAILKTKRKKNLLKQQYGNFKAEGTKTLEQTFNRLQVIISQIQFMDVDIEKNNLNQKFLTSLAHEWLIHTILWRNRNDLDSMSLDDLYNHLKVYEAEVQKKPNLNPQDMAFISSSKNRNNKDGNTVCVTTATTPFPTDKFSKRTGKKISIQGSDVAGFDKSKVECFNCHKMGHFVNKWYQSLVRSFDLQKNKISSTAEEENAEEKLKHSYKLGIDQLEGRLAEYKERKVKYIEKIRSLERDKEFNLGKINKLTDEVKTLKEEKDVVDGKLARLRKSSKDLKDIIESQRPSPTVESTSAEGQNKISTTAENRESTDSILSKPAVKFVKACDKPAERPTTNKAEFVKAA
nr:hypothetical protein [Tanacetum cinerariifolium]